MVHGTTVNRFNFEKVVTSLLVPLRSCANYGNSDLFQGDIRMGRSGRRLLCLLLLGLGANVHMVAGESRLRDVLKLLLCQQLCCAAPDVFNFEPEGDRSLCHAAS